MNNTLADLFSNGDILRIIAPCCTYHLRNIEVNASHLNFWTVTKEEILKEIGILESHFRFLLEMLFNLNLNACCIREPKISVKIRFVC